MLSPRDPAKHNHCDRCTNMTHSNNFVDVLFQKQLSSACSNNSNFPHNYPLRDTVQTLMTAGFWIDQSQAHSYWFSRCKTNEHSWVKLTVRRPDFPGINADFFFGAHQWFPCLLLSVTTYTVLEFWNQLIHLKKDCLVKRHHLLVYFGHSFSEGDSCRWEAETKGPFELIGSTAR